MVRAGHDRFAVEYGPILLAAVGGAWHDELGQTGSFLWGAEHANTRGGQRAWGRGQSMHSHTIAH